MGGALKFLQELEAAGVRHRRAEPVRVLRRSDRQRVRVAVRLWALAAVRARRRAGCGSVADDADVPAFFPPLCLRLGLLRQEARVRRAVLLIVLFADVLLLRLGVTGTSRAVLIIVLFADVLFLLLLPARN